jgi:membrane protein
VAVRVKDGIRDDHTSMSSAGVAFFAFLAFIPGLAALVSIYGFFANPADVKNRVDKLTSALPGDAKRLISDQLGRLVGRSNSALGVGLLVSLVIAVWAASSGIYHLAEAIGIAYDEDEGRSIIKRRLGALAMTMGLIFVGAIAIGALSLAARLGRSNAAVRWVASVGAWVVLAALFLGCIAALYRVGPDRDDPKWQWVTPGAVFALVAWIVISLAFRAFVANFGSYDKTYGSLAAVVVMLFWLYLSAFAVIVGAQLNSELEHQTARDTTVGTDQPRGARDAEVADSVGRRT